MAYAEKTAVSVAKTKADIEELIQKAGAGQFVSGYKEDVAVIGFSLENRQIRFLLPLPDKQDRKFWYTPEQQRKRTEKQAYEAWEQACRSRWRALYLIIKAKLEAEKLQRYRVLLWINGKKLLRVAVLIQNRLGAHHFHAHQPRALFPAKQAKWQVAYACHWCQYQIIF